MQQTKWLVTGAAGFIGHHLVESLLSQGYTVVGIDNYSTGLSKNVERLQNIAPWSCFHADIRDFNTIHALLEKYQPDIVVHLAAQISVAESIQNPLETHDINVTGFLNVLQAAKQNGAKRFIYASSSAVYGESPMLPISETAPCTPLSMYGLSKYINEQQANLFADAHFSCVGLRLFNIYGAHQRMDSPYSAVIPKWLSLLHADQPITLYGDGTATRDYCHVSNVVYAIQQLAQWQAPIPSTVFNIGSGEATSLHALSQLLLSLTNRDLSSIHYAPWNKGDIVHSVADLSHAQQMFGYEVKTNLIAGLKLI